MGITASCCHAHGAQQADSTSDRHQKKSHSNTSSRSGYCCPESSIFCPVSPLETVTKPQPILSRVHFLVGCSSVEEHNRKIRIALHVTENMHGMEGLQAMGFEYRRFYCIEHQALASNTNIQEETQMSEDIISSDKPVEEEQGAQNFIGEANTPSIAAIKDGTVDTEPSSGESSTLILPRLQHPSTAMPEPAETSSLDADFASQKQASPGASAFDDEMDEVSDQPNDHHQVSYCMPLRGLGSSERDDLRSTGSEMGTGDHLTVAESLWEEFNPVSVKFCINCRRKLVHIKSGTVLDGENRPDYIADGIMYDRVAVLCQEAAHEAMMADYDLEWTHVAPSSHNGERPEIRALVSKPTQDDKPKTGTIFIVTGRGAVRAGIFSRNALVCGEGLEVGSAWHLLREAALRKMHVILPDPNCRGDRWGYDVVRQTFRKLWPENRDEDVYMIIHSAGGSNVQRFLLDTPDTAETHLPQIRAMALTDSTHNLQWCKKEPRWRDFWESDRCIYFKSAQLMRDAAGSRWYLQAAGTPIQTDSFWQHRFGKIHTCNAGTDIHAMTNWFAHQPMWKHLDEFWQRQHPGKQPGLF